jgi:hypothetical protein
MILLQWIQSMGLGILLGIGIGYLTWKLPQHLNQWAAWRWERAGARSERKLHRSPKIRAQVERIRGAFQLERTVPNEGPELLPGERVLDFLERTWDSAKARWVQFVEDTAPEDPIQMVRSRQAATWTSGF